MDKVSELQKIRENTNTNTFTYSFSNLRHGTYQSDDQQLTFTPNTDHSSKD